MKRASRIVRRRPSTNSGRIDTRVKNPVNSECSAAMWRRSTSRRPLQAAMIEGRAVLEISATVLCTLSGLSFRARSACATIPIT